MLITGAVWVIGSSWMLKPRKEKGLRKRGTGQSRVHSERDHRFFQKQILCLFLSSRIEFQCLRLRLGIILSHIWFLRIKNFLLSPRAISIPFWRKYLFLIHPSSLMFFHQVRSNELRPTVRCAVTRADREWCPEGCRRIVLETWKRPAAWADFDRCVPVIFKQ